jgi:hypothetical protein
MMRRFWVAKERMNWVTRNADIEVENNLEEEVERLLVTLENYLNIESENDYITATGLS